MEISKFVETSTLLNRYGSRAQLFFKIESGYTQKIIFEILLNQTEINRKMIYTISYRFDLIRFWKDFSVCSKNYNYRAYNRPRDYQHDGTLEKP